MPQFYPLEQAESAYFYSHISVMPTYISTDVALNAYLHKHIGIKLDKQQNNTATAHFITHTDLLGPTGTLHGGIVYTVCDTVSFLALIPNLREGESAATVDHSVSVIGAVMGEGKHVELTGTLIKRGKNLAFLESKVTCDGKTIAIGKTTKAIIKDSPITHSADERLITKVDSKL